MENIQKFEAGYILSQLWIQIKSYLVAWFDQVPFFLPLLIISSILILLLLIMRKLLAVIDILKKEQVFLELTPPANTAKSAYTTQQFFSLLHNIGSQRTIIDKLLGRKVLFSFEIVSTREKGIRYIIKTTPQEANNIERLVVSYLPYVRIQRIDEYLSEKLSYKQSKVIEFKLSRHFAFPLKKQDLLYQHDPVAYITGMMTKLLPGELLSFQIVLSPTKRRDTNKLSKMILRNEDILHHLNKIQVPGYLAPVSFLFTIISKLNETTTGLRPWYQFSSSFACPESSLP